MRTTILTKTLRVAGMGAYCDLGAASEVFLIFTTQLYHVYAIVMQLFTYLDKREVL